MNKFTLDFVNNNIKTNTQASSFPVRKQQDIKIIPQDMTLPNTTSAKVLSTTTVSPIIKTA